MIIELYLFVSNQYQKIKLQRYKCSASSYERCGNSGAEGVALMPHLMRCAYASRLSNLRLESNISFRKNIAVAVHPLSAESNFQLKGFHSFYSVDIFFQ